MTAEEMIQRLQQNQNQRRFKHTLGVAAEAVRLAPLFKADPDKAYIAGLLHDCAKNFTPEQVSEYCRRYGVTLDPYCESEKALVHAFLGPTVARADYGVEDSEILDAIYYHTTGKPDMTRLEKLIYIADMTEPGRELEQSAQLREIVEHDADEALVYALDCSIKHVISKGGLIHPNSVLARNYILINRRKSS